MNAIKSAQKLILYLSLSLFELSEGDEKFLTDVQGSEVLNRPAVDCPRTADKGVLLLELGVLHPVVDDRMNDDE